MKKHVLLAMAVIMVLGSIKALAMSEQEAMDMNQQSKVEAMVRNQQMDLKFDEAEHGNGQIQASQKNQIRLTREKSAQVAKALIKLNQEDLLKESNMGQIEDLTDRALKESKFSENSNDVNFLWELSEEARVRLDQIIKTHSLKLEKLTSEEVKELDLF